MIVKYIRVSLLTLLRILGTLTPGCIDLMSCTCAVMSAQTATSEETGEWLNLEQD